MVLKDRLDHLRGIVKTEKKVKVTELSQRFDVTEETIRRDFGEAGAGRSYYADPWRRGAEGGEYV